MDYIILENVNKEIKKKRILVDINLKLERGLIHVFVGRNASGKTMLLRMISGLILPTSGYVRVFDQEISREKQFPRDMGLIIERVGLWNNLSGLENLSLLAEIRKTIGIGEIRESLARVGIDPGDKKKYKEYSMGMKQKLALAQAIMEKPELLILDEPTSGLDEDSIGLFRDIIREEKSRGTTCLIATHQIEDVRDIHDRMYYVKDGRCTIHKEVM